VATLAARSRGKLSPAAMTSYTCWWEGIWWPTPSLGTDSSNTDAATDADIHGGLEPGNLSAMPMPGYGKT